MNFKKILMLSLALMISKSALAENVDVIVEDNEGVYFHRENDKPIIFEAPKTKIILTRNRIDTVRAETISIELIAKRSVKVSAEVQELVNKGYSLVNYAFKSGQNSCSLSSSVSDKFLRIQRYVDSINRTLDNREMPICAFYVSIPNDSSKEMLMETLKNEAEAGTLVKRDLLPLKLSLYRQEPVSFGLGDLYEHTQNYSFQRKSTLNSPEAFFALGYATARSEATTELFWKFSAAEKEKFLKSVFNKFFQTRADGLVELQKLNAEQIKYNYMIRNLVGDKTYVF